MAEECPKIVLAGGFGPFFRHLSRYRTRSLAKGIWNNKKKGTASEKMDGKVTRK